MNHLSDQELVAQYLITGNAQYFAQIYTRHRQRVYQKCLLYTGNTDDSEDFVQDIFLRLTCNLTSYKGNSKFTTWLHSVTVNHCIDQLRKRQKNQLLRYSYLHDWMAVSDWPGTYDESSFQVFEQVLRQLPKSQHELLLSKYEEGVPIKDIALRHDLTASAVKMRIKRARDYARSLYDKILAEEKYP